MDFYVLADEDTVAGFRYAGIPGRIVRTTRETEDELGRLRLPVLGAARPATGERLVPAGASVLPEGGAVAPPEVEGALLLPLGVLRAPEEPTTVLRNPEGER